MLYIEPIYLIYCHICTSAKPCQSAFKIFNHCYFVWAIHCFSQCVHNHVSSHTCWYLSSNNRSWKYINNKSGI